MGVEDGVRFEETGPSYIVQNSSERLLEAVKIEGVLRNAELKLQTTL